MKPSTVPEHLKNPINYKIIILIIVGVLSFQSFLYLIPESENVKQKLRDFCYVSFPKIEHEVYYAECMKGSLVGFNQWVVNQEN